MPPDDAPVALPAAAVAAGFAPLDGVLVFTGPADGVLAVAPDGFADALPVVAVADPAAALLAVEEAGFEACCVALEGVAVDAPVPEGLEAVPVLVEVADGLAVEVAVVLAIAGFLSCVAPVEAFFTSFTSPGRASITGASRARSRFGAAAGEGCAEGLFWDGAAFWDGDAEAGLGEVALAGPFPGVLPDPPLVPGVGLPAAEFPGAEFGFLSSVSSIFPSPLYKGSEFSQNPVPPNILSGDYLAPLSAMPTTENAH